MNQKELKRFHANRQTVHCAYVYLACFILDLLKAMNQRYTGQDELQSKIMAILAKYFGSLEQDGQLQDDLNKAHGNILRQLSRDFPHFSRQQVLVFSYYAVGVPVPVMNLLAGISSDKSVSVLKTQMKKEILCKASPRREEYLLLLEREKLPNWVRSAIFA